jgi:hypothetical protein
MTSLCVTPANAGVQRMDTHAAEKGMKQSWMPAFAGMTGNEL